MNISFIIPCYNCESYIINNIYKLYNKLRRSNIKYEIILVDDCSNDKTFFYINKLKRKIRKLKILKNSKNYGKSFSIIRGIKTCKYNYVIFIDCDFPYFKSIFRVVKYLKKNDMVIINRREKKSRLESKNPNLYQSMRMILGFVINSFIRIWFNIKIKDTQAGLKGFIKPKGFSNIKFFSKSFFFFLEFFLLFVSVKKKIVSLSTSHFVNANSTINFFDLKKNFEILSELIKICLNYKLINEKTNNYL